MSWGLPSTPLGQFLNFSPDGNSLAVGTWNGRVMLWSTKTRRLTRRAAHPRPPSVRSAFSADGRLLAAGSRSSVTLWDTATFDQESWFDTLSVAGSIAFSPGSETIAIGSEPSHLGGELRNLNGEILKRSIPV